MILDRIALTLSIVGALNWGGVGLFRFDLVSMGIGYGRNKNDTFAGAGGVASVS